MSPGASFAGQELAQGLRPQNLLPDRVRLAREVQYLGLPFYRLAGYQAMLGVPVPDATQWDQIERVADCAHVIFEHLEVLAAQGELIYQDDTAVRILSLLEENRHLHAHAEARGLSRTPERTGMYTTALVVKVGERTIYLLSGCEFCRCS